MSDPWAHFGKPRVSVCLKSPVLDTDAWTLITALWVIKPTMYTQIKQVLVEAKSSLTSPAKQILKMLMWQGLGTILHLHHVTSGELEVMPGNNLHKVNWPKAELAVGLPVQGSSYSTTSLSSPVVDPCAHFTHHCLGASDSPLLHSTSVGSTLLCSHRGLIDIV
jgi:hypothetical protein